MHFLYMIYPGPGLDGSDANPMNAGHEVVIHPGIHTQTHTMHTHSQAHSFTPRRNQESAINAPTAMFYRKPGGKALHGHAESL